MYYKVVNQFDIDMLLKAAEEGFVPEIKNKPEDYKKACKLSIQSLKEQILRFDLFYGEHRKPDADLGGYAYFLPTLEDVLRFFSEIKARHGLTELPSEFDDTVAETADTEFVEELFIPSSDFAILCTYPRRKNT